MIDHALAFAECNFPIIPVRVCRDGDRWHKQPMVGWDLATTNEITIRSWWSDWPDALPAIPLRRTNWAVIDADRREGVDGVAQVTGLGPLGPHSRITTPSGGLHLVFAQPDPPITKLNWCEGVEVLGTSCLLTCYDLEELKFPFVAPRAVLPEMFRRPKAENGQCPALIRQRRTQVIGNLIKKAGLDTPPHDPVLVADLAAALRKMNARNWRGDHDGWFALMAACAYVGIACDDFVAWSISDPHYAHDDALIRRKWRSLKPKHGGALMAALKARGIKVKRAGGRLIDEVPLTKSEPEPRPSSTPPNLRRASARINSAIDAIVRDPTEHCLFWASCLCAEIVHECKLNPTQITDLIAGNAYPALHKTLGKEGIRRTIENAFRHVEEKYLATPTDGQKGELTWQ
jgi:hypothetical protein